jgi:mannitol-1-phosphate/altronate dehydrogenase
VLLQPRGTSFFDYCVESTRRSTAGPAVATYELDTVAADGTVHTDFVPCYGVLSLSDPHARRHLERLLDAMTRISVIGVGVTEAGLASAHSSAVEQLVTLLFLLHRRMDSSAHQPLLCPNPRRNVCIINTDNIPLNGNLLRSLVLQHIAAQDSPYVHDTTFASFIQNRLVFLNTMVDRITSERPGSHGCVPRAEPTPLKALVLEDIHSDLPEALTSLVHQVPGLVLRRQPGQLLADIQLKLRIANATHTAMAHAMALSKLPMTHALVHRPDILSFIDTVFSGPIRTALFRYDPVDVLQVYQDWRQRLLHASFGLNTFFITQHGAAKCGIRLGPTILDLLHLHQVRTSPMK